MSHLVMSKLFLVLTRARAKTAITFCASVTLVLCTAITPSISVKDGWSLTVFAEAQAQAKKKQTKRSLPASSQRFSKKMLKVNDLMSPETGEPNFKKAKQELQKIANSCNKESCNAYELAQLYYLYGFAEIQNENESAALSHYRKVIQQSPNLPWSMELGARYAVAQIAFNQQRYDEALRELRAWMSYQDELKPNAFFMEGRICFEKKDKRCALDKVTKAVRMKEAEGGIAQESWYSLLNNIYVDQEDYKKALPIIRKLVTHYPKQPYWRQMGQMYGVLGEDGKRIGSLEALRLMGGLKTENDKLNLAYLFLGAEAPYTAAKLIDDGMKDGSIKKNLKNYETLGLAYSRAKEHQKAVDAYEAAGNLAGNGDNFARASTIYLRLNDYDGAIKMSKKALNKGIDNRAGINLDLGIAYFNKKQFSTAIKHLSQATGDKKVGKLATTWLNYAKRQKDKYESVRNFGKPTAEELKEEAGGEELSDDIPEVKKNA